MTEKISHDQYKQLFGVTGDSKEERERQETALRHALDIRKFEIELYWKRAAYFWTFIGAALAAYGLVQRLDPPFSAFFSVVVASLGLVFSLAWYCVNRGSKFWQENWENHVDLLEDRVMGPLYKTVVSQSVTDATVPSNDLTYPRVLTAPADFSVSKINQIVSAFVFLLWIPILLFSLRGLLQSLWVALLSIVILILAAWACRSIWINGRTDPQKYDVQATKRQTMLVQ